MCSSIIFAWASLPSMGPRFWNLSPGTRVSPFRLLCVIYNLSQWMKSWLPMWTKDHRVTGNILKYIFWDIVFSHMKQDLTENVSIYSICIETKKKWLYSSPNHCKYLNILTTSKMTLPFYTFLHLFNRYLYKGHSVYIDNCFAIVFGYY